MNIGWCGGDGVVMVVVVGVVVLLVWCWYWDGGGNCVGMMVVTVLG